MKKSSIILFIFITFLLNSQLLFSENVLDDRFYDYCFEFQKRYPLEMFDNSRDFYDCAWSHYLRELNKTKYNFTEVGRLRGYFRAKGGRWIKLTFFEYIYTNDYYTDEYRKNKKGFKIYGMYYFFNEMDYQTLFNKENVNNHYSCSVFHTSALNEPEPLAFNFYVKMEINNYNNIQLDFYQVIDMFDTVGQFVFSVVLLKGD